MADVIRSLAITAPFRHDQNERALACDVLSNLGPWWRRAQRPRFRQRPDFRLGHFSDFESALDGRAEAKPCRACGHVMVSGGVDVDSSRRRFHADDFLSEQSLTPSSLRWRGMKRDFPLINDVGKPPTAMPDFVSGSMLAPRLPQRDKSRWRDPRRIVRQLF